MDKEHAILRDGSGQICFADAIARFKTAREKHLSTIANEYETLVNNGGITWLPLNLEELPDSTKKYVKMMLVDQGWNCQVSDKVLQGTYLFKVDHPVVQYLHHVPQNDAHMWANEGFHESLDNSRIFDILVLGGSY